jgi:hypothetical protein
LSDVAYLAQDIRFAFRTFKKAPVFVVVAVLSLAFGIGANTAIFTLVDQVLLRLLPVKEPGQLVTLWGRGSHYGGNNGARQLPAHRNHPFDDFDHAGLAHPGFQSWRLPADRDCFWIGAGASIRAAEPCTHAEG